MLPRLQAEEQLRAYEAVALGMGSFDRNEQRQMLRNLQETAFGDQPRAKVRATDGALSEMGIGVTMLPPPSEKAPSDV